MLQLNEIGMYIRLAESELGAAHTHKKMDIQCKFKNMIGQTKQMDAF